MTTINQAIKSNFKNDFQKVVVNLFYTSGIVTALQNEVLKPFDLSIQQYNILRILKGQHPNPASVNLLIDRMLDKNSNASRLVEKLRKKNLLERKTCKNDRRQVDIFITQKGIDLLKKIEPSINKLGGTSSNFTQNDAKRLSKLLDKFRNNFNI